MGAGFTRPKLRKVNYYGNERKTYYYVNGGD